mgnify:CR=1 FL=1
MPNIMLFIIIILIIESFIWLFNNFGDLGGEHLLFVVAFDNIVALVVVFNVVDDDELET